MSSDMSEDTRIAQIQIYRTDYWGCKEAAEGIQVGRANSSCDDGGECHLPFCCSLGQVWSLGWFTVITSFLGCMIYEDINMHSYVYTKKSLFCTSKYFLFQWKEMLLLLVFKTLSRSCCLAQQPPVRMLISQKRCLSREGKLSVMCTFDRTMIQFSTYFKQ